MTALRQRRLPAERCSHRQTLGRVLLLLLVLLLLSIPALIMGRSMPRSGADLHALLEIVVSVIGMTVGLSLVARHAALDSRILLIGGLAYLFNGAQDLCQGLLSSSYLSRLLDVEQSALQGFIPLSDAAGRAGFGFLLLLAPVWLTLRPKPWTGPGTIVFSAATILLAVLGTLLLLRLPLPSIVIPEQALARPIDLLSAGVLAGALVVWIRLYWQRREPLLWWIALSLSVSLAGQLVVSRSAGLYDAAFDLAHVYKMAGYVLPLLGLSVIQIADMRRLNKLAADSRVIWEALDQHTLFSVTDRSGRILEANAAFSRVSGYAREELIGRSHRIVNSGTHPSAFWGDMWRAVLSGRTWRSEVCNRRKDGSLYWVDSTNFPLYDARGDIDRIAAMRFDISDRKEAQQRLLEVNEKLAQANQELEGFVYTASHDLKSPLLTIQGFAGLVRQDIQDGRFDRLAEFTERIGEGVVRMRTNIDDLLQLSRVGRSIDEVEVVRPTLVFRELAAEVEMQFAEVGATITIEPDIPSVTCDPVRLRDALQNLLGNALRHGRCPDRELHISLGGVRRGELIRLFVADNGPGVPPEYHERVFSLFQRLASDVEGTGIGLAIVKRIAEVHGGGAGLEETPGGGATFFIELPIKPREFVSAPARTESRQAPAPEAGESNNDIGHPGTLPSRRG